MLKYVVLFIVLYAALYTMFGLIFTFDSEGFSMWYIEKDVFGRERLVQKLIWKRKKN